MKSFFFFLPACSRGVSLNSLEPDSVLLQCDSKLSVGGQMPVRRPGSNDSRLPEAQHTPLAKFILCTLDAALKLLEEFWWCPLKPQSFTPVKSIGHCSTCWSASLCFKHVNAASRSYAGSLQAACVSPFLSCVYLYRKRDRKREAGSWWRLGVFVWSSSKEVQMKRPPEGRAPPPLSLAPHFVELPC